MRDALRAAGMSDYEAERKHALFEKAGAALLRLTQVREVEAGIEALK